MQVIVRTGSVSRTLQMALIPHGEISLQGSRHSLLMQAVCGGQSESILHLLSTEKQADVVLDICTFR
jgi:hypothetical protein